MDTRSLNRADRRVAEQKLLIIRQQELAATLMRNGDKVRARQARARLMALLNELDLMQARAIPPRSI